jgi:hypothetical protein
LNEQLPNIINDAERTIGREIKVLIMCHPAVSNFTAGTPIIDKPNRWRQTISINFGVGSGARSFVFPRAYEFIRMVYPQDTVTGAPVYYADYDINHWILGPTPDQNYDFELTYYENPAYLTTANQTNWWSEFAPELLKARVFYQTALFLKDSARQAEWLQVYSTARDALNNEDVSRIVDRTTVRRSA